MDRVDKKLAAFGQADLSTVAGKAGQELRPFLPEKS